MKLEQFTTTPMNKGKVQIMFDEPLYDGEYVFSLFLEYFGKKSRKKKIRVFYESKPQWMITGIACNKKMWGKFLVKVKKKELAKGWYSLMRDVPLKTEEDVVKVLKMLQEAGTNTAKKRAM